MEVKLSLKFADRAATGTSCNRRVSRPSRRNRPTYIHSRTRPGKHSRLLTSRYTNVRESLIYFLFPRPVRIQSSVAASVTQQRLNSVQPNASTVRVWRQLSEDAQLVRRTNGTRSGTYRDRGGRPAQFPPERVLCMSPAPTPCRNNQRAIRELWKQEAVPIVWRQAGARPRNWQPAPANGRRHQRATARMRPRIEGSTPTRSRGESGWNDSPSDAGGTWSGEVRTVNGTWGWPRSAPHSPR